MLSERVDLTENRDFRFSADELNAKYNADLLAIQTVRSLNLKLLGEDDSGEQLKIINMKLYPWHMYEVDSDRNFHESYFSDDPYSNMLGIEVWGELTNPFFCGSKSERRTARRIFEMSEILNCDNCGVELKITDEWWSQEKGCFSYLCKKCNLEARRDDRWWSDRR